MKKASSIYKRFVHPSPKQEAWIKRAETTHTEDLDSLIDSMID